MGNTIQVLFVDDEEEFVTYMKKRLERHDLEVHAFTNPLEALKDTKTHRYDVGLLDLKMPEMDGEELLDRLKARDPGMEVIILTGHGSIESAFRSAKVGAYEYLLKPCDFDELVTAINKAFAKRVKSLGDAESAQVENLMKQAMGMSPLALLKQLKNVHDGIGTHATAAAMAEGGDRSTAREILERSDDDDT